MYVTRFIHSHENQVIFMWNVLHEHSIWKRGKQQRSRGGTSDFGLRTSDFGLRTSDFGLRTSDFPKSEVGSPSSAFVKAKWQASAYPGFCGMMWLGVFLLPRLDRMSVHRRITPNIKFASTYLFSWVKSGSVRVKCHNTMFPARVRTQTARNWKEKTVEPPVSAQRPVFQNTKCFQVKSLYLGIG